MRGENKRQESSLSPLYVAIPVILIVVVLFGIVIFWQFKDWEKASNFGNAFGALNTLFSGLAFAVLIYTILLQRQELGLQRQELSMTRQELSGQKEALQLQNELTRREQYESSFYKLLDIFQQTAKNMLGDTRHGQQQGRMYFLYLVVDLYELVFTRQVFPHGSPEPTISSQVDKNALPLQLIDAIQESMKHSFTWLQGYLDTFYVLYTFVKDAPFENTEPYKRLLIAQLSPDERLVLVLYSNIDEELKEICSFLKLNQHLSEVQLLDSAAKHVYNEAQNKGLL